MPTYNMTRRDVLELYITHPEYGVLGDVIEKIELGLNGNDVEEITLINDITNRKIVLVIHK